MEWRSVGFVSNPDPSLTVTSFSDFTVTYVSVQSHRHSSNWGQNRRISCEVIFKPGRALQQDGITLSCCMVPLRMLVGHSCPASFATDACRASTSEDILDRVGITHRVFNRHSRPSGCPHGSTNIATKEHHSFQREATNSIITALPAIDRLGAKQQASTCKPEFRLHLFGEHLAREQIHGASRTLVLSSWRLLDGPVRDNTSLVCQLYALPPFSYLLLSHAILFSISLQQFLHRV